MQPNQAEAALEALSRAGMRVERPPEEWLFKAWHGAVLIDLIFEPSGLELTAEVFERAESIPVMALSTPVMALEDLLVTMLYALDEHALDYSGLLAIARALREQIDWPQLRARAAGSPLRQGIPDPGPGARDRTGRERAPRTGQPGESEPARDKPVFAFSAPLSSRPRPGV